MPAEPIHELPSAYHEVRHVQLTEDRFLLWLNILSVIPIIGMIALMAVWWVVVSWRRVPEPVLPVPWWLALIAAIVIVLPLHEFLHGVTIARFGQRVRYGAKLSKGVLFATADNALFRRNEYLAVALAPLVGITLLVMMLMAIVPQWLAYYCGIAAVLNAGGAIGDLWSVGILWRYPVRALVRDEADGFRIYVPGSASGSVADAAPGSAPGSSIQNREPPSSG